jgi:antitoxin HicB
MIMRYPALFEAAPEGGFVVTFRDIPEAITQGDTRDEAVDMAVDVLTSAMDFYFEDRRAVPLPSPTQADEVLVELPASVAAKILLLNEVVAAGISNVELARRMGTRPQEVQRIVNLEHATKIDTIAKAMEALGKHLEVRVM